MIQRMQHYTQDDMQHSNPNPNPQVPQPPPPQPLGMLCVGVRMLHIMLCIMLHVLDQQAYISPLKVDRP